MKLIIGGIVFVVVGVAGWYLLLTHKPTAPPTNIVVIETRTINLTKFAHQMDEHNDPNIPIDGSNSPTDATYLKHPFPQSTQGVPAPSPGQARITINSPYDQYNPVKATKIFLVKEGIEERQKCILDAKGNLDIKAYTRTFWPIDGAKPILYKGRYTFEICETP